MAAVFVTVLFEDDGTLTGASGSSTLLLSCWRTAGVPSNYLSG